MNENNDINLSSIRAEMHKEATAQAAKLVILGAIALASIAVTGWWLYLQPKIVELAGGVPKGAVVAFELTGCQTGWEPYKKLYGRFIRGIDKSGGKRDPEGERGLGGYQSDDYKSHGHDLPREVWSFTGKGANQLPVNNQGGAGVVNTKEKGGLETRPKNIALLYCIKT